MKIKDVEVFGFKKAIIGMRKSWDSENKIDSVFGAGNNILFGENDKKLILKLCSAGTSHRKFLRAIHIQANVTAPIYFLQQLDTYKIATTRLSSSTMHTITKRNLTLNDFEFDCNEEIERSIINLINTRIDEYNRRKTIQNLRKVKQILPNGFLYNNILDFNYETFINMYAQRHNHKLMEWQQFLTAIESTTPMMKEILNATVRRT